jgi:hypothetical protein
MITPVEIYLFPCDDSVVWADTDESGDGQGVKYVRADKLNEIKAQAIEEYLAYTPLYIGGMTTRKVMREYANKLRGEK